MKLLVATSDSQGMKKDDFFYAKEGEIVQLSAVCRNGVLRSCGCERSFSGTLSRAATTTAKITDVPTDFDELVDLIHRSENEAGFETSEAEARLKTEEIIKIAAPFEVGDIVETYFFKIKKRPLS